MVADVQPGTWEIIQDHGRTVVEVAASSGLLQALVRPGPVTLTIGGPETTAADRQGSVDTLAHRGIVPVHERL